MKFTIEIKKLKAALNTCSKAISSNPVISILGDFLFELEGDALKVTATDLEVRISTIIEVSESIEKGVICVPHKKILNLISSLPAESAAQVRIDVSKANLMTVTSVKGSYKMPCSDGKKFPQYVKIDEKQERCFDISSSDLSQGFKRTVNSISSNVMRSNLNGLCLILDGDLLKFVATDANMLSKSVIRINNESVSGLLSGSILMPKKVISIVSSKLSNTDGVSVSFDTSNINFSIGDVLVSARLHEEKFPNYKQLIPENNELIVQVNRKELLESIDRISGFANEITNAIIFTVKPDGTLSLVSQDKGMQTKGDETLQVSFNGSEEFRIGLNAIFMASLLKSLDCESVTINMGSESRPILILPDSEEKTTLLLMPVFLEVAEKIEEEQTAQI